MSTPADDEQMAITGLPPIPRPACTYADHSYPAYTRRQMEEYARSAARSENEALRKALVPFARDADKWADMVPDDYSPKCTEPGLTYAHPGSEAAFTVGDLRAVARLLKGNG